MDELTAKIIEIYNYLLENSEDFRRFDERTRGMSPEEVNHKYSIGLEDFDNVVK